MGCDLLWLRLVLSRNRSLLISWTSDGDFPLRIKPPASCWLWLGVPCSSIKVLPHLFYDWFCLTYSSTCPPHHCLPVSVVPGNGVRLEQGHPPLMGVWSSPSGCLWPEAPEHPASSVWARTDSEVGLIVPTVQGPGRKDSAGNTRQLTLFSRGTFLLFCQVPFSYVLSPLPPPPTIFQLLPSFSVSFQMQ